MNKKTCATILLFTLLTACVDNSDILTEEPNDNELALLAPSPKTLAPAATEQMSSIATDESAKMVSGRSLNRQQTPNFRPTASPTYYPGNDVIFGSKLQWNRESYNAIKENGYISANNDPLSTFSVDVDTASYANIRRFINRGALPPVGAVRIEELVNYFSYDYPQPTGSHPLAITAEVGPSPFTPDFSLVRIGIKAKELDQAKMAAANLVFLVDVSGSMQQPNKLELVRKSLLMITDQITAKDRVAIVAYAGTDRVVLQPTSGKNKQRIRDAIESLQAGGATHGSKGIHTAYELAEQGFIPGGNNRVILASDGDFNVGVTSRGELQRLIAAQRQSGIYLTVLGYGMGNYHDDTMEVLANTGNGNYAYIDTLLEAEKVLVKEMSGTLYGLADDVKIQVEFNPSLVGAYRLIGYENRALADEEFNDETKDAGEIGMGHTVTALYEIIPAGHLSVPTLDNLKYQRAIPASTDHSRELLTVKLRYKDSGSKISKEIEHSLQTSDRTLDQMPDDFRFAAAVAGYGMLLRTSEHLGVFTWKECLELIRTSRGEDKNGYRAELLRLVEMSRLLNQKS